MFGDRGDSGVTRDDSAAANESVRQGSERDRALGEHADWLNRPETSALMRPYAWTRGRTSAIGDLAMEALISTTSTARGRLSWQQRAITEMCTEPRSVAEIAALMSVPIGVARVLLADLAASGQVVVHATAQTHADGPDLALMTRVLDGLRDL